VQGKLRRARQLEQLVRQAEPAPAQEARVLACGPLRVDPAQHRVWMDEQPIELSAREFVVLAHLARRHGCVVSLQEMIQLTHDLETDHIEAGTLLRPVIRSLRRKLGYPVGEMGCIETVRGVGYRLLAPSAYAILWVHTTRISSRVLSGLAPGDAWWAGSGGLGVPGAPGFREGLSLYPAHPQSWACPSLGPETEPRISARICTSSHTQVL
jgi:DNA-binding winged helix-turn-helix (wHTH) protein